MSEEEINNDETVKDEKTVEQGNKMEEKEEAKEELTPLELKEIEYKELHDKYIRLFSEFDNFRKRTAKEKIDLASSAGGDIMKQLLPILDDFDRAIQNNENSEDIDSIKEGFKLIHNKLFGNLTSKGLKPMESMDEVFDVNKHEALTQIPAASEEQIGKVVDVIEKVIY